jgi:hypothetical protein
MAKLNAKYYMQPAFLICTGVLVIAGSVMSIAIEGFSGFFEKTPWPLKKNLELLDESDLATYKVISKGTIENEQIIKELATEDYIEWVLEDTQAPEDSPVGKCSLFITYYGLPDRVPHVPDECYVGVGYQRLAADSVTFRVNKAGVDQELPGRYIVFSSANANHWRSEKFSVLYLSG